MRQLMVPKPAFHLVGAADSLVKPYMQQATYDWILTLNGCKLEGIGLDSNATLYRGESGNDVTLFKHLGGHEYPKIANVAIINFFKKHVSKDP